MAIIVASPYIEKFSIRSEFDVRDIDTVFLSNPVIQKKNIDLEGVEVLDVYSIGILESLKYLNDDAKRLATGWYGDEPILSDLRFEGINLAGLYYIENTYYFIGLLKAIKTAEYLFERFEDNDFVVLDDGSFWAKAFLMVADVKGKKVASRMCSIKKGDNSGGSKQDAKMIIKGLLSKINRAKVKMNVGCDLKADKRVLYSCAPRFSYNIWRESTLSYPAYYLRPIFSLKVFKDSLSGDIGDVRHILPEYFISHREKRDIQGNIDRGAIFDRLDSYFSRSPLKYDIYDIWPIFRDFFKKFIEEHMLNYAVMVKGLVNVLDEVSPGLIVMDEDTTPFNKALVECSKNKGISTIQLNHGILGHSLLKIPINSDKIAAYGDSSKQRLLDWNVPPEQIALVGAPAYGTIAEEKDRDSKKNEFFSKFNIDSGTKVLTLATSPFRTEERSDFIDSFLTPDSISSMISLAANVIKGVPDKYIKLVVKFHPREKHEWFTRDIFKKAGIEDKVIFLRKYDLAEALLASDLVLTYGTTVYYDAMLLGIPAILFDSASHRALSFLSSRFLDLDDPERTSEEIFNILSDTEQLEQRLVEQKKELEWHFVDRNRTVIERVDSLFSSVLEGAGKNWKYDK